MSEKTIVLIIVTCQQEECTEYLLPKGCDMVFLDERVQCGGCGVVCEKVVTYEDGSSEVYLEPPLPVDPPPMWPDSVPDSASVE